MNQFHRGCSNEILKNLGYEDEDRNMKNNKLYYTWVFIFIFNSWQKIT